MTHTLSLHEKLAADIQSRPWVAKGNLISSVCGFYGFDEMDCSVFDSPETLLNFILEKNNPNYIGFASEALQAEPSFYRPVLDKMPLRATAQHFSHTLRNNEDFMLAMIAKSSSNFNYVQQKLSETVYFARKAMAIRPQIFSMLNNEQRQDPVCFELLSNHSGFLQKFIGSIPHGLITKQHCIDALKMSLAGSSLFKSFPPIHQQDKEVFMTAMTYGTKLDYLDIDADLRLDRDVQIAAFSNRYVDIKNCPDELKDDEKLMLLKISHQPSSYALCSSRLAANSEIIMCALKTFSGLNQTIGLVNLIENVLALVKPHLNKKLVQLNLKPIEDETDLTARDQTTIFINATERAQTQEIHNLLKQDKNQKTDTQINSNPSSKIKPLKLGRI